MAWKKSPPELIAAFEKAKPADPSVTSRPMFGYPALFLKGNMFAGTYQDKIVVRFGDDRTIRLSYATSIDVIKKGLDRFQDFCRTL